MILFTEAVARPAVQASALTWMSPMLLFNEAGIVRPTTSAGPFIKVQDVVLFKDVAAVIPSIPAVQEIQIQTTGPRTYTTRLQRRKTNNMSSIDITVNKSDVVFINGVKQ